MLFRIALILGVICALALHRFIASNDAAATRRQRDVMELRQVHVVFRHGARAPIHTPSYLPLVIYDNDAMTHAPHTHVRYRIVDERGVEATMTQIRGRDSPYFGRLTGSGAGQLYDLGARLRRMYGQVTADDVVVRSTRIQRTLDSARSLLAGLFPGDNDERVFEMRVRGPEEDEVLIPNFHAHNHGGRRPCCFVERVFNDTWRNPDVVDGVRALRLEIEKLLPPSSGEDVPHVSYIRDNLMCHRHHRQLPPELQDPELHRLVEAAASKLMQHAFNRNQQHSRQMAQLSIGRFVQLLLHNLDEFGSGAEKEEEKKAKMFLYSGHDTTLIPLLNVLGIYDGKWPPFASHVIIELYRDDDVSTGDGAPSSGHFVRVIYNSAEQKLPGCDVVLCPLDDFRATMDKFALGESDYDVTCANCDY